MLITERFEDIVKPAAHSLLLSDFGYRVTDVTPGTRPNQFETPSRIELVESQ